MGICAVLAAYAYARICRLLQTSFGSAVCTDVCNSIFKVVLAVKLNLRAAYAYVRKVRVQER